MQVILKGSPPLVRARFLVFVVWSLTLHRNGPIGPTFLELTPICIPLLLLGSLLIQVILKGSPPCEWGWTCVILSNLCPNICLVPNYAWNGPIGLNFLEGTQICIPLLVVGSL